MTVPRVPTTIGTITSSLQSQGRIQDFFRRGCTRLLLYFNTNKPHSFFFLQNTSCIRKPQAISGGGGVHTPCTLPLDPPLSPTDASPLFSSLRIFRVKGHTTSINVQIFSFLPITAMSSLLRCCSV